MLNITKKFRKELFYDRRNYKELVTILLSNGTRLELTNEHLLEGIGFTDMVSEDNNFQIGAAIINSASVKINNMYDDYTDYNFNYAKVYASVGLDFGDGTSEIIRKFTAYVDEAKYNGSAIELSCLDYMGLFDQVYDGQIVFPATTGDIVRYCCTKCNVTLNTTTFPRDNITISEAPDFGDNCTYRQLIAWVAQQSCCFARCNAYGELEIKWYDMASLNAEANRLDGGQFDKGTPKYQTGDHADGGGFMTDGDEYDVDQFSATPLPVHVLNGIFSCEVCKDPVTITGISVTSTEYDETTTSGGETTTERRTYTAMVGTTDYVLAISGNPLIASQAMATEVANYIASVLVGFTFWIAHVSHLSDPSIEAGDVMLFSDYKGVTYRGVVSSTTFKCGESQTTDSSAETPVQNTKTQRSGADSVTKAIMDIENWLLREKTAYEQGIDDLSNRLDAKSGLYTTKETTGSGDIWYLHDKPLLADSTKVIKITADAIGFSTDGGTNWNSGMTIDGQFIATILNAQGVNADWIRTGTLQDSSGSNFRLVLSTGEATIKKGSITLGDMSNPTDTSRYFFNVSSAGALRWNAQYSSMSANGELNMRKGSIQLGYDSNANTYNFMVNDQGQVAIKQGSIQIGDANSYHFFVNSNGKLNWRTEYSSMSYAGEFSCTKADITGTVRTVSGNYETLLEDGWIYFKHGSTKHGKIGTAFVGNKRAFNINLMSGAQSFGIYSGDDEYATLLASYEKSDGEWWFKNGASGTFGPFEMPVQIDSSGAVSSWSPSRSLVFKNGLCVGIN